MLTRATSSTSSASGRLDPAGGLFLQRSASAKMMSERVKELLHPSLRSPGEVEPNWAYFVAIRDEEGLQWAVEYGRKEHAELMTRTKQALVLLRTRQIEQGCAILQDVERGLQGVETTAPGVVHVLGRWYYGALAYYYYCRGDFAGAERSLDEGDNEVRRAIELRPYLIPFVTHCHDFAIQRVRIVRGQRRWPEMWQRIDIVREMVMGEHPFCSLSDGTPIDLKAVQAFYRSIPDLTPEEQQPLRWAFDDDFRGRFFGRALAQIFAMPGFVIPYLPGG